MTRRTPQTLAGRTERHEHAFQTNSRSFPIFRKTLAIIAFSPVTLNVLPVLLPSALLRARAQSVSCAYDGVGQLITAADGSNNVAGYQYDLLRNLLGISRGTEVGFDIVPIAWT
jgi:YD repeat-containing protein